EFENARVRWFLSIDYNTIPEEFKAKGMRTFRAIKIGGELFEFSEGFTDLHHSSYKEVLAGKGFSLEDTRASIDTVYAIRNAVPVGLKGDFHTALYDMK
ncbi:MAG: oxidoreductase, partial [Bacteroidota bacterium]